MRQFSAALLSRALGPLMDFLSSPRGRHSAVAGRRRRSTRVRRYVPAPLPAPEAASASAPRPAPPGQTVPAEDVALIRPYASPGHERERECGRKPQAKVPRPRGHQPSRVSAPAPVSAEAEVAREFARVQARARALVREWAATPVPAGDLLSGPSEWDELAGLTRTWLDRQRQAVPA
ncbi:hypothetical protein HNR06_002098 [Nocardiopsis arvandica]|uniref:Uncharacterized protein n=1 Tax=Nocardiopsis sinuspersici TaxID=501010 RepID=A0A7Y9XB24_9ACTN|nr:hypothetical protein [Nocardiopsis sinuspersici]NYH52509.1 hypothetical protein [Nocardiopsis sinuspersici]